jgi:hypothetical protein
MMRDELLARLGEMPSDCDVVVNLGSKEFDILEIEDVDGPTERQSITLSVHPADLHDVFSAYRAILGHPPRILES